MRATQNATKMLLAACVLSAMGAGSRADTFVWDGGAGPGYDYFSSTSFEQVGGQWIETNNWGDSVNWGDPVPKPGPDDDVVFNIDARTSGSNGDGVLGLTNHSRLEVVGQLRVNGGLIENTGEITVENSYLNLSGDTQLTGGGVIRGSQTYGTFLYSKDTVTLATGSQIRGFGGIDAEIVNQSTITAEGGELIFSGDVLDNTGGRIVIAGDGELGMNASGFRTNPAVINGGVIHGETGSMISGWNAGGQYQDVTLTGEHQINYQLALRGTIVNNGRFGTTPDGARVYLEGDVTLDGNGEMILGNNGITTYFSDYDGDALTNGCDHTIRGTGGSWGATIVNRGVLSAGEAPGEIGAFEIENLVSKDSSALEVDLIGGAGGVQFDSLTTNSFEKAGLLQVNVGDDTDLSPGDVFAIARADDSLTGQFDLAYATPLLDGDRLMLRTRDDGNAEYVELVVSDEVTGDFNGDGWVDAADFAAYDEAFNLGQATAGGDALIEARLGWRVLQEGVGSRLMTCVPEPSTMLLLAAGAAVARRRSR
ncbi:MAG: PEP-CTERM sorting domain-containing protein [Planctomycetota bacterium]